MDFRQDFIEFALNCQVLRFGEFKTKAGRLSPYFFNAGLFNDGNSLGHLAQFYAKARITSYNVCYTKLLRIPTNRLHQAMQDSKTGSIFPRDFLGVSTLIHLNILIFFIALTYVKPIEY